MSDTTLSQQLLQERKDGMSEMDIAKKHNLTTPEVRVLITTARLERHMSLTEEVRTLAKTPMSNIQIAQELGLTESEVRLLLKGE